MDLSRNGGVLEHRTGQMSAPSPAAQIEFLGNLQRLLDEGQFTATYKYALLSALSDLSVELGDDSGDELSIEVDRIAEKFIEYYWRQVQPYRGDVLHQSNGKQAAILRHLAEAQGTGGAKLSEFVRHGGKYKLIRRQIAQVVRKMPLWKLQTVAGATLPFLYDPPEVKGAIVLKPGVAYCFRAFHSFIRRLLRSEWLGYIRGHKANLPIIGDTSDLDSFLFGSEREHLGDIAAILSAIQHRECFYCGSRIQGTAEVDHFIPWSRYPVDLGHNFVMAHRSCNQAKSDHLAAPEHLERWLERNDRHRTELEERFRDRQIIFDEATSIGVAKWAYSAVDRTGGLAWVHGPVFKPLDPRWRRLLEGRVREGALLESISNQIGRG